MKRETKQTYAERILAVLVHIQGHLDETLPLEELAEVAEFSPFHFHRIFRGMVGESVAEHVRRLRLERAAHHLKHGNEPVTRIAFAAGYEAHESFTRAFRAMFGQSPSEFRDTHRPLPVPSSPSGVYYNPDGGPASFSPVHTGAAPVEARIEKLSPMRVAFMRHVGPYMEVGSTWQKLMMWAGPRGLIGGGPCLGICHDDPAVTPPDKIRYDACIPVGDDVQPEGDVGVQEVPGGEYVIVTHRGPYEKLSETYAQLCGEWLPASGRELMSAAGFEMYRNNPMNTAPADLLTDIHMPLVPQ